MQQVAVPLPSTYYPAWMPDTCHHVVYKGPGEPLNFEAGLPMPRILQPTDVVIKVYRFKILNFILYHVVSCFLKNDEFLSNILEST